ncbi:uncharacterized protein [Nicotiana sylvestris]|uniref:uncharacterized protein n=1 Tax=Nicotiana sylvestris TaxID=4096 RepID=UPI00388C3AB0
MGNEVEDIKRRWFELLKDYDIDILYHPGKDNVGADALSQKSRGNLAHLEAYQRPLAGKVHQLASLGVRLADSNKGGVIVHNRAESSLVAKVKEKQFYYPLLAQLKEGIHKHKTVVFFLGMDDGTLREVYWLNDMKRDVANFVARCLNCQQAKSEHQRPGGLAQSIEIPMWKW